MKYRKKPVVIEAVQFLGFDKEDGHVLLSNKPDWLVEAFGKSILFFGEQDTLRIKTLEGVMSVRIGDWIIKGVNGELYPCKPDIFEKSYEPVCAGETKIDTVSEFKKGDNITIVLYNGDSELQAKGVWYYLDTNHQNNTPIPIRETMFHLRIENFNIFETFEPMAKRHIYEVKVKGELI